MTTNLYLNGARLGAFFLAGMLLHFLRERLPATPLTLTVAVGGLTVATVTGLGDWIGRLPFAFILLWLGARLPIRVGSKNDISYGVYIWAFPVQQMLAVTGLLWLGPFWSAVVALLVTLPLAWASWRYVERPAMRLTKRIPKSFLGSRPKGSDHRRQDPRATESSAPASSGLGQ